MSDIHTLVADVKEGAGKGAARAARRAGRVPAVIYGADLAPLMISLEPRDLAREIGGGGFFSTLYDIQVAEQTERVLARDLQLHPVSDRPLHVDFLRVSASTEVTVQVHCSFKHEEASPGLKRGGVLNIVRHELELVCRADAIPHQIDVDLTGLEIGDSVHISEVSLPEGVRPAITGRDFTIASIAAPSVIAEEAAEVEEGEAHERHEGEEVSEEDAEESGAEE